MDIKSFLDGFQKLMEDTIASRDQATLGAFNNNDEELLKHTYLTRGVVECLTLFKNDRMNNENDISLLDGFQKKLEETISLRNQTSVATFNNSDQELLKYTNFTRGFIACLTTFRIEREKFENTIVENSDPIVTSPKITDAEIIE